jgi:hypothetical protein
VCEGVFDPGKFAAGLVALVPDLQDGGLEAGEVHELFALGAVRVLYSWLGFSPFSRATR